MPDWTFIRNLRGLLPLTAAPAISRIGNDHALWPGEMTGEIISAAPGRQAEFAAGRAAARLAMYHLGLPPVAIPMRPDRAPHWPHGLVGSITHSGRIALAAVAHQHDLAAIGIDLEIEDAVEPALWPTICRPEELDFLQTLPREKAPLAATALFCAKEAAYKAQYPLTRQRFDFDRLSVSLEDTRFTARFTRRTGPFGKDHTIAGHVVRLRGYMLATMALTAI